MNPSLRRHRQQTDVLDPPFPCKCWRGSMCLWLLLTMALTLTGCAAKSAYTGHVATDLSGLNSGISRSEVEKLIGQPEREVQKDGVTHVWYVFDRGFVGTLEKTSAGEKILWAPIMAWGEMVSLGIVELMILCQTPCQKGLLEVRYGADDRLLTATEHTPPDSHPIVKGCATTAIRADLAVCKAVREQARASTLPKLPPTP